MAATVGNHALWTVPLRVVRFKADAAMNRRLAEIVLQREEDIRSGTPTDVAGLSEGVTTHWQEYNVLNWPDQACREFREFLVGELQDFLSGLSAERGTPLTIAGIACWANILRPGQSLHIHHHDPAFLLGNYCIQTGYDDDTEPQHEAGYTIYYRPGFIERSQEGLWDSQWRHAIRPVEGQLVICPGFIRHEVRPFLGITERISLGIDCYLEEQNALIYFGGERWYVPDRPADDLAGQGKSR